MKNLSSPRCARRMTAVALTLCSIGLVSSTAQAQPDLNNGAKADNPANRPPRKLRPAEPLAPPQTVDEYLRRQLKRLGALDVATQNTIVTYVLAEVAARQPLLDKGKQLQLGLKAEALSNVQVAALLNDYQGAVDEDKTRHDKAEAALRKAIDFSKMPKVETLLTLMGVVGNGPIVIRGGVGAMNRAPGGPAVPAAGAAAAPAKI